MKVLVKFSVEVDLVEIYKMCMPIDKQKCKAEIRAFVSQQIELRSSDDGWELPTSELIAGHLIGSGYANYP